MNRRVIRYLLSALCLGIFASVALPLSVGYADSVGPQQITMSPTSSSLSLSPGQIYKGQLSVINQGQTQFNYLVYASPYSVKTEDYTPYFTPVPGAPEVAKWFSFSSTGGNLAPNSTALVNYTISVPSATPAGGYYAVAFAQTNNKTLNKGVTINSRVGSIFYINIPGNLVNSGNFQSWNIRWLQKPPLTSSLYIEDSGSLNFEAKFHYQISDLFNEQKYVLNGQKALLPHTIRRIDFKWPGTPNIGIFKVSGSVTILGKAYNQGTKYVLVMSRTIRIYFLISLIAIVAAIVGFSLGTRKAKKNKIQG